MSVVEGASQGRQSRHAFDVIVTPSQMEGQQGPKSPVVRRGSKVSTAAQASAKRRGAVQIGVVLTHCSFVFGAILLKSSMKGIDEVRGEVFSPLVYAFYREASAGPLLFLLSVMTVGYRLPLRKDAVSVFFLGFFMFVSQLLYIMGVDMAGVLMASCVQPSVPVFTVMIGVVLGVEKGSMRKVIGIMFAVVGAVSMVVGSVGGAEGGSGANLLLGDLCILVNALAMAAYYLLAKRLVAKYSAVHVAAWAYAVAATLMGVAAMLWTAPTDWVFPKSMLAPLIYWVLICSVGGYLAVTYAMNYLPASQVAAFQTLQPFVGAVLAVSLLNEKVNRYDLGAFGIVVGLLMVTRDER